MTAMGGERTMRSGDATKAGHGLPGQVQGGGVLWPRVNFWLLLGFFGFVFLVGGASRADVQTQIVVRILAVAALAVWAFQLDRAHLLRARIPFTFLAAAIALIVLQLVPLPPAIWEALPGRQILIEGYALAGIDAGWRPLTFTPDRTLNSLLALLPPLAAAAGLALVARERYPHIVLLLIFMVFLSSLLAIVQITVDTGYLYRVTNRGSAVGLFANRNHQALFLSIAFPLLACWAVQPHPDRSYQRFRTWVTRMVGVILVPMILVTGSRAGLLLGLVGGLLAFAIAHVGQAGAGQDSQKSSRLALLIPLAMVMVAGLATVLVSRDKALQRLFAEQGDGELRIRNLDMYIEMIIDYLPFGSGFGSFDPVYRIYEPLESLSSTYLNHAHNDLVQIAIEGGVGALLLAVSLIVWLGLRSWQVWTSAGARGSAALGRTGSAIALLILIASLGDYPLRTPAHSVLMVFAIFLMLPARRGGRPGPKSGVGTSAAIS